MTLYHFGISGGKDSTALLLWATYESGIPLDQIRATFCDTDNENQITYDYVKMLSACVFPIETIRGPLGFYDLARKKKRFPSRKARFCTQHLKMMPTQKWVLDRVNEGHEIILHSGVRASESTDRAKLPESEWDGYFACQVRRPILKWTLADIWAIHERYGVYPNPLYGMGFNRVGCFPCINSCKSEVKLIAEKFPERIDRLRAEEFSSAPGKLHTFFAHTTVPEVQRSGWHVCKSGERMKVATIDDVVLLSKTVHGGKQFALDLPDTELKTDDEDSALACPSSLGQCE